ncbi:thiopurine S-methyltransferase [Pseudomonas sp. PS1]|uniref:Thiopurine S-methyltransferase n=1 Tax=Stutzerimonas marianensis TaxID=2929513 RepID=A0A9X1W340_9GAMM|nr:thiopurine S-methyltransferase [Pseudomonas marianensis]
MDAGFWHRRWSRNEIGFHLNKVNPYLQSHWPGLELGLGARVLVPLCGKSLDMAWLAAQGFEVLGIELSEKAAADYYAEQGSQPEIDQRGAYRRFRAGGVEILCGDFFSLTTADVTGCAAFYDRAALIALPPDMRQRYVRHLAGLFASGGAGLLVTLDYEQSEMDGPPFAVSDGEVRQSLASDWEIRLLAQADVLDGNWKFLQRGLTRLDERCYHLIRRPQAT